MTKIHASRLLNTIDDFPKNSVLVLGDIILDTYIWGNVERICPEAPVPVVEVTRESNMLGGSANVVNNLKVLGAEVSICGVVGPDPRYEALQTLLKEKKVAIDGLIEEKGRPTSQKTRIVAGHQQVVRFDYETKRPISEQSVKRISLFLDKKWDEFDAVIISDYAKGVIGPALLDKVRELHQKSPKLISVDPKEPNMENYKFFSLVTPNKKEAAYASGKAIETEEDLKEAGRKMINRLQCENLVITLGSDGMALFKQSGEFLKIPTFAKEVFDVSGAGDTVVSVLTLALCAGATLHEAVVMANFAAGVVVGKLGTAAVTPDELKKYIQIEKSRVSSRNLPKTLGYAEGLSY